ncbi:zinc-binding alcohol dehydrogenase [Nocardioides sp. GY 10113]|uniref:zinc-binding dehydrogenase n=1 Tax=Nocardioides sp. GY 10113 TaxID=2569761 RepID=UPI0010A7837C|nr:zinc-binding dehydrogenase [Nocardioides sp. GY 10113]TIC81479.1 zinc-binding alcohol dehydrogenase [Nocardioides sp. GY 10113]
MRAVVLTDGKLELTEIPEPTPGPGEVLVEVLATGICGSDKSCIHHPEAFNAASQRNFGVEMLDLSKPLVLGHEFSAKIAAYGPETEQKLPVGTRVVAVPALPREQSVLVGFGGIDTPGGFAEKAVLNEQLLVPVPDNVSDELAALTEPLAVALHSLNRIEIDENDVPLVVGCGPIGLATILLLKARGIGPVVATDLSPERREFAKRVGADVVVDPAVDNAYQAWMAAAATDDPAKMAAPTMVAGQLPLRPTVGFECTGVPGLLAQMMTGAPPASRIMVSGMNLGDDVIQPGTGILKELDIKFTLYYTPQEYAEALRVMADGEIDASPLITGEVGYDGIADAVAKLGTSPTDAKILIKPGL